MREVTTAQYALGVRVGRAACEAYAAGATHDEVLATLRHQIATVEANRDLGLSEHVFADAAARQQS